MYKNFEYVQFILQLHKNLPIILPGNLDLDPYHRDDTNFHIIFSTTKIMDLIPLFRIVTVWPKTDRVWVALRTVLLEVAGLYWYSYGYVLLHLITTLKY
jgi:hypothetical protein